MFEGGHLRLALQPIVSGKDARIMAFECLLRSTHNVLDGPLSVIRAAERHEMLPDLGKAVSKFAAGWMEQLPDDIRLFMNLHPDELADPDGMCTSLGALAPLGQPNCAGNHRAKPSARDRGLG